VLFVAIRCPPSNWLTQSLIRSRYFSFISEPFLTVTNSLLSLLRTSRLLSYLTDRLIVQTLERQNRTTLQTAFWPSLGHCFPCRPMKSQLRQACSVCSALLHIRATNLGVLLAFPSADDPSQISTPPRLCMILQHLLHMLSHLMLRISSFHLIRMLTTFTT